MKMAWLSVERANLHTKRATYTYKIQVTPVPRAEGKHGGEEKAFPWAPDTFPTKLVNSV